MSIIDDITGAVAATAEQIAARVAALGSWGTAGPDAHVDVVDVLHPPSLQWVTGWWAEAKKMPACAGRSGGAISPWATVIHSTDMPEEDFDALVKSWTTRPGDGACAHFLIGRDAAAGVVQFVPLNRNGNHAGGPGHGVFDTDHATGIHPNLVAVGIELHCAGGVRRIGGSWRFVEDGAVHGAPIPDADVIPDPDPQRPGRGWHVVTPYQLERVRALLADLEHVLAPVPAGARSRSTGETVPSWAIPRSARIVAHASLDPEHRADPWPPTCAALIAA